MSVCAGVYVLLTSVVTDLCLYVQVCCAADLIDDWPVSVCSGVYVLQTLVVNDLCLYVKMCMWC